MHITEFLGEIDRRQGTLPLGVVVPKGSWGGWCKYLSMVVVQLAQNEALKFFKVLLRFCSHFLPTALFPAAKEPGVVVGYTMI